MKQKSLPEKNFVSGAVWPDTSESVGEVFSFYMVLMSAGLGGVLQTDHDTKTAVAAFIFAVVFMYWFRYEVEKRVRRKVASELNDEMAGFASRFEKPNA